MRAVVQRVSSASVTVENEVVGNIDGGVVVLLGVAEGDTPKDAEYMASKIANLRIFEDENGVMNRSLLETGGAILAISQFTLLGDCRKGRRPSYVAAASPEAGERLYDAFCEEVRKLGVDVETGRFRTMMFVSLVNEGPVTLLIDSEKAF